MVVRLAGEPGPVSLRIGLTLAQAGEFGLALITLASLNGVIQPEQASFIVLIAVFSMLLSPALIRNSKPITEFLLNLFNSSDRDTAHETHPVTLHQSGHALIGGFGRVGQTIAQLLDKNGISYIAIDQNIDIVSECRERGHNVIYGDCTSIKLLRSCHIAEARLAVLTFRSVKLAKHTITEIRRQNIQIPIIVRCYEHGNFEELISLGADKVISEMLEASLIISSQVLAILDIDPDRIDQQINEIRHHKQGVVK